MTLKRLGDSTGLVIRHVLVYVGLRACRYLHKNVAIRRSTRRDVLRTNRSRQVPNMRHLLPLVRNKCSTLNFNWSKQMLRFVRVRIFARFLVFAIITFSRYQQVSTSAGTHFSTTIPYKLTLLRQHKKKPNFGVS